METVYLVQRLYWEYNDSDYILTHEAPVRVYRTQRQAETVAQAEEKEARRAWGNPLARSFAYSAAMETSPEAYHARLQSIGIPLPEYLLDIDSREWWESLTEAEQERAWAILEHPVFFEVVAMEIEP